MIGKKTVLMNFGRLCLLTSWLLSGSVFAHPFHTTTAEMEFNSATKRFEVALKIPAGDFEHMVQLGMSVEKNLDATASAPQFPCKLGPDEIATNVARYIDKRFSVTVAGKPCRFEWVGAEDDQQSKWIYFELILPSEQTFDGELTLTNKVLCDRNNDQFNTVVFLSKAGRVSLKTQASQAVVALPRRQ